MTIVTLTPSEAKVVRILAKDRYEAARQAGIANARIGPQSDENTDLDGLGAEVVAAKFLNLYPDLTPGPRSGGADLINGRHTIDVKHTRYKNGRLLATLKKADTPCDVYVLVTGKFPEYEIVGWAWGAELLQEQNIIDLGHGKGYALNQDRLHKEFKGR